MVKNNEFSKYTIEELLILLSIYDKIQINFKKYQVIAREEIDSYYNPGRTFEVSRYKYSKDFLKLLEFISSESTMNCRCPQCGKGVTLKLVPIALNEFLKKDVICAFSEDDYDSDIFLERTTNEALLFDLKTGVDQVIKEHEYFTKTLICAHDPKHVYKFFFKLTFIEDELTFQKVGQFPNKVDFMDFGINDYKKILNEFQAYDDFYKGYYMANTGFGIASYAYLRRVWEKLIKYKFDKFNDENKITNEEFEKYSMSKKIEYLKVELTDPMVDNKCLYSIISEGIHNLDEEKCLKYCPILKKAIDVILSLELVIRNREKLEKEIESSVQKVNREIKEKKRSVNKMQ